MRRKYGPSLRFWPIYRYGGFTRRFSATVHRVVRSVDSRRYVDPARGEGRGFLGFDGIEVRMIDPLLEWRSIDAYPAILFYEKFARSDGVHGGAIRPPEGERHSQ